MQTNNSTMTNRVATPQETAIADHVRSLMKEAVGDKVAGAPVRGDLMLQYNEMITHANALAAKVLAGNPDANRDLDAFAASVAQQIFTKEFQPPSTKLLPLDLEKPLEWSQEKIDKYVAVNMPCPFMGNGVKNGAIKLYGSDDQPLIKTEDIIKAAGKGTLGSETLEFFATANQTKMHDKKGNFTDQDTPTGFISAKLSGSQGDHPNVSTGIFKTANPAAAVEYMSRFATGEGADRGVDAAGLGKMIAHRLHERSQETGQALFSAKQLFQIGGTFLKAFSNAAIGAVTEGEDLANLLRGELNKLEDGKLRDFIQLAGQGLGTNPVGGKAGEMGLWITEAIDNGNGKLSIADLKTFVEDRGFPPGFLAGEKNHSTWTHASLDIFKEAIVELTRIKLGKVTPEKWPA